MAASPNTLKNVLVIFAGVMAVASIVMTALFVKDRRQRMAGLLLSTAIILQLVGSKLADDRAGIAVTGVATVLIVISAALNFRIFRAQSH